jgi:hypothetical protein
MSTAESQPTDQPRLADVLDAWRAAERRLASRTGDPAAIAAEVRRLRDEYRRLQDELVRDDGSPDGAQPEASPG